VRRDADVAVWVGEKSGSPTDKSRRERAFGLMAAILQRTRKKVAHTITDRRMDITWLTGRIAVGGGIWTAQNMAAVAREGITHIIDMQIEFDDTPLARNYGVEVLWNPTDDDFEPKPAELFRRGVEFAESALADDGKLFIHCAAGVHRAPMMALAVLGSMGWNLGEAMELIAKARPVADFADVYVRSVERFLEAASPQRAQRNTE
jgi:protein-tyrosine phosphatase